MFEYLLWHMSTGSLKFSQTGNSFNKWWQQLDYMQLTQPMDSQENPMKSSLKGDGSVNFWEEAMTWDM